MTTSGLSVTVQVTLDANGNGTAGAGPLSARETWQPDSVHVSVASNTKEATCSIFVGDDTTQRNFRDTTFSGSSGDSSDRVNSNLRNPQKVWAVWSGGDAHATASLTITGTRSV